LGIEKNNQVTNLSTTHMTKRIAFVGTAGCGKTTLTYEISSALKKNHVNAELVPEYIREYISKYGKPTNIFEQYHIFDHQTSREDAGSPAVEVQVCDTIRGLGYFYACQFPITESKQQYVVADLYSRLISDLHSKRYDHIFFLPMAETYSKNSEILSDGVRFQSLSEIAMIEQHMTSILTKVHKVEHLSIITAPLANRVEEVMALLKTYAII
jgi:nicotinamide riboside kinase